MRVWLIPALLAPLLCVSRTAGAADDPAALRALMKAAQAKIVSFRLQISSSVSGLTGVGTVVTVPEHRLHMTLATGPLVIEQYVAGDVIYQKIGGTAWRKQSLPPHADLVDLGKMFDDKTTVVVVPDVVDGGVTYGAMTITTETAAIPGAPPVGPVTLTCTYDKRTYLVHTCTTPAMTETFDRYDDPANAVTLPPELASAADMGAAPAASPSPAPPTH